MDNNNEYVNLLELIRAIDNLPKTTRAESVHNGEYKTGRWIKKEDNDDWWFECSRCAYEPQDQHVPTAFCCNCGAKMDEYTTDCETCRFYNKELYWCSRRNDTTYDPNCSSYKAIE